MLKHILCIVYVILFIEFSFGQVNIQEEMSIYPGVNKSEGKVVYQLDKPFVKSIDGTEIESMRSSNTKTYAKADNSRELMYYLYPVHYKDECGDYQELSPKLVKIIDTGLSKNSSVESYSYKYCQGQFQVYLKENLLSDESVRIENYQDESIVINFNGIKYKLSSESDYIDVENLNLSISSTDSGIVTYTDAENGISIECYYGSSGFNQQIILNDKFYENIFSSVDSSSFDMDLFDIKIDNEIINNSFDEEVESEYLCKGSALEDDVVYSSVKNDEEFKIYTNCEYSLLQKQKDVSNNLLSKSNINKGILLNFGYLDYLEINYLYYETDKIQKVEFLDDSEATKNWKEHVGISSNPGYIIKNVFRGNKYFTSVTGNRWKHVYGYLWQPIIHGESRRYQSIKIKDYIPGNPKIKEATFDIIVKGKKNYYKDVYTYWVSAWYDWLGIGYGHWVNKGQTIQCEYTPTISICTAKENYSSLSRPKKWNAFDEEIYSFEVESKNDIFSFDFSYLIRDSKSHYIETNAIEKNGLFIYESSSQEFQFMDPDGPFNKGISDFADAKYTVSFDSYISIKYYMPIKIYYPNSKYAVSVFGQTAYGYNEADDTFYFFIDKEGKMPDIRPIIKVPGAGKIINGKVKYITKYHLNHYLTKKVEENGLKIEKKYSIDNKSQENTFIDDFEFSYTETLPSITDLMIPNGEKLKFQTNGENFITGANKYMSLIAYYEGEIDGIPIIISDTVDNIKILAEDPLVSQIKDSIDVFIDEIFSEESVRFLVDTAKYVYKSIACHESKYRDRQNPYDITRDNYWDQFYNYAYGTDTSDTRHRGTPIWGYPEGYGLSQYDFEGETYTLDFQTRILWSWPENLRKGIEKFKYFCCGDGMFNSNAMKYLGQHKKENGEKSYTATMALKYATLMYNEGTSDHAKLYYWVPGDIVLDTKSKWKEKQKITDKSVWDGMSTPEKIKATKDHYYNSKDYLDGKVWNPIFLKIINSNTNDDPDYWTKDYYRTDNETETYKNNFNN